MDYKQISEASSLFIFNTLSERITKTSTAYLILHDPKFMHDVLGICVNDQSEYVVILFFLIWISKYVYNQLNILPSFQDLTKQQSVKSEIESSTVAYEINTYYYEINCAKMGLLEKKRVSHLIYELTQTKPIVACKHIIVIRNMHDLGDQLGACRAAMEKAMMNAIFLCTTSKPSYVQKRIGSLVYMSLRYDKALYIEEWINASIPLTLLSRDLLNKIIQMTENSFISAVMIIDYYKYHKQLPKNIVYEYMQSSLQQLESSCPTTAYNKIADIVNDIISSNVSHVMICKSIINYFDKKNKHDMPFVMSVLSKCDTDYTFSNKPHMMLEKLFMDIYDLVVCND